LFLLAWGYHRLSHIFGGDRRSLLIALTGFAVLLLASTGVSKAMRFWSLKWHCRWRRAACSATKSGA
jgi:S-DNA-T family DNA segregation ATPase FtsK/SpoIIIE